MNADDRRLSAMIEDVDNVARVLEEIAGHARSGEPVLLLGSRSSGASFLAEAIHGCSPRRDRPFVRARCGQYTGMLLEAKLFGSSRRKRAFWASPLCGRGTVAAADGGSLFVEQIQHATPNVQARLFELIAHQEYAYFERTSIHRSDVRLIASAAPDLEVRTDSGLFLPKLFGRLQFSAVELSDSCASRERILAVIDLLREKVTLQTAVAASRVTEWWMNAARSATQTPASLTLRRAVEAVASEGPGTASVEWVFHAALRRMSLETHDAQLVGAESESGGSFDRKEDCFETADTSSSWLHAGRP